MSNPNNNPVIVTTWTSEGERTLTLYPDPEAISDWKGLGETIREVLNVSFGTDWLVAKTVGAARLRVERHQS